MATARCPCSLASGGTADQTALSARCPPGHPQTRGGTARWACRGGRAPPGRGEGDTDGKEPPSTPQAQGASGAPPAPPTEGLGFPIWDQDVAQSRTRWSAGPVGPRPGLVVWQEAPVPHETVSKSQVAAAQERRGPATPTGPGMRKELGECAAPLPRLYLLLGPGSTPAPASQGCGHILRGALPTLPASPRLRLPG